ncbi:hypothetical protein QZH41_013573, partial [Actinostola sp. cb2023]
DKNDKGRDENDKGRDKNDKGRDENDKGRDENDKGRDENDKGRDENDKGRDKNDKGRDENDKGRDENDKGRDKNDKDLPTGKLRLRGGSSPNEGRIEMQIHGVWGGIITIVSMQTANVICRMLGYKSALTQKRIDDDLSSPKWSKVFVCNGDEADIRKCKWIDAVADNIDVALPLMHGDDDDKDDDDVDDDDNRREINDDDAGAAGAGSDDDEDD